MSNNSKTNNLDEYLDPLIYDAEYGKFEPEGPFFLSYAKEAKGVALDLACGTGRLTIPISKEGISVTGVDICEPMLELAKVKAKGLNIDFILGDIRKFELGKKFGMIFMGGNAFQALLTKDDQESMLNSVRKHLSEEGIFIFGVRNPVAENPSEEASEPDYWHKFTDPNGIEVVVSGLCKYESTNQIATYTTTRKWPDYSKITEIKLRYTYKHELVGLLERCGFQIVETFGEYDKIPFAEQTSPSIVMVARRKAK